MLSLVKVSKRYFANGCKFAFNKNTTELLKMVQDNPLLYRVGATVQINPKKRIWSYPKTYDNSEVWFSDITTTGKLKELEQQLLDSVFNGKDEHPYNKHKISNISEGQDGYVYIIKVGKEADLPGNPETEDEEE